MLRTEHSIFILTCFPRGREDSSYGLALPVLWKLWDRLNGVLAMNPSWIFSRGLRFGPLFGTCAGANTHADARRHILGRAEKLSELARQRDVTKLSKMPLREPWVG